MFTFDIMVTLTNEDNMELMARYSDGYFDLAIVDPPYGMVSKTRGGCGNLKQRMKWDIKPSQEYFNELIRVSKNQIIWGGNYFTDMIPVSDRWVVWYKKNTPKFISDCELAWTSSNKQNKVFEMHYFDSNINKVDNKKTKHPTQKPIELYSFLLENYTNKGDLILDTHLGSGSIAIACHDYGFDLTACEIDKDYFDAAVKRFDNHKSQLKLF